MMTMNVQFFMYGSVCLLNVLADQRWLVNVFPGGQRHTDDVGHQVGAHQQNGGHCGRSCYLL